MARHPVYRRILEADRNIVDFAQVQDRLQTEKTVALQYFIGDTSSFLLVYGASFKKPILYRLTLTSAAVGALRLQNKTVEVGDDLNSALLRAILYGKNGVLNLVLLADESVNSAVYSNLSMLWGLLIPDEKLRKNMIDSSPFERVVILPDGVLAEFPFEAMIVDTVGSEPDYLLTRGPAVYYAPSATVWYHLAENGERHKNHALTAGNPDYARTKRNVNESDEESISNVPLFTMRTSAANRGFKTFPALPKTADETKQIAEYCAEHKFSVIRLDGSETTEKRIRDDIAGKQLVHFACHGLIDSRYGNQFGALAVTPESETETKNDGFLTLGELYELDLSDCDLAILSACDTNRGTNQQGEGTWSLGRGMLVSGARRVVTSDWSVDDASTSLLISQFVKNSLENKKPNDTDYAGALQKAKCLIMKTHDHPEWKHPFYWAPFVLTGKK